MCDWRLETPQGPGNYGGKQPDYAKYWSRTLDISSCTLVYLKDFIKFAVPSSKLTETKLKTLNH